MTKALAVRFEEAASLLEKIDTLPNPYDLYYAVKKPGYGTGWTYHCIGLGLDDIRKAADELNQQAQPEPRGQMPAAQGGDGLTEAQQREIIYKHVSTLPGVAKTMINALRAAGYEIAVIDRRPAPMTPQGAGEGAEALVKAFGLAVQRFANIEDGAGAAEAARDALLTYIASLSRRADERGQP